jgi:hypothetical protein
LRFCFHQQKLKVIGKFTTHGYSSKGLEIRR